MNFRFFFCFFLDLPRAPAPLCDHGLPRQRVNVRTTTTIVKSVTFSFDRAVIGFSALALFSTETFAFVPNKAHSDTSGRKRVAPAEIMRVAFHSYLQ